MAAAEIDWELKIRNEKRGKLLNGCKKLSASQLVTEMPREAFFFFCGELKLGERNAVFFQNKVQTNSFLLAKGTENTFAGGVNQLLF